MYLPVTNKSFLAVSFLDLRDEIFVEEPLYTIIWFPAPLLTGSCIIQVFRPRINDTLAVDVWLESDLRTGEGLCPVAEKAYDEILTLPLFPRMSDDDVSRVIGLVEETVAG